jgi:uncharacterized membrane protein YhaH (DUF805 family)
VSVRFTVTLAFEDYVAANLLYQRRYWLWSGLLKMFCVCGLTFAIMMLAITALDEPLSVLDLFAQALGGMLFGLGMAAVIPLVSLVAMRLRAKGMFEQLSLGLPVTYEVDGQGFHAANEQSTSTLAWDKLCNFVQNDRLLLLRRTATLFFALPKSQLAHEDLDALLALLRQAGVKES